MKILDSLSFDERVPKAIVASRQRNGRDTDSVCPESFWDTARALVDIGEELNSHGDSR